jgi:hypothetical protein
MHGRESRPTPSLDSIGPDQLEGPRPAQSSSPGVGSSTDRSYPVQRSVWTAPIVGARSAAQCRLGERFMLPRLPPTQPTACWIGPNLARLTAQCPAPCPGAADVQGCKSVWWHCCRPPYRARAPAMHMYSPSPSCGNPSDRLPFFFCSKENTLAPDLPRQLAAAWIGGVLRVLLSPNFALREAIHAKPAPTMTTTGWYPTPSPPPD